jgi:hypothetical protein
MVTDKEKQDHFDDAVAAVCNWIWNTEIQLNEARKINKRRKLASDEMRPGIASWERDGLALIQTAVEQINKAEPETKEHFESRGGWPSDQVQRFVFLRAVLDQIYEAGDE